MNTQSLKKSIFVTSTFVSLLWCIKSFELIFHIDLVWLGVYPQKIESLWGILTAPFIHGSIEHLFNNTLSMLLLGSFIIYGYPKSRWRVIGLIWLISGIGVWLFARDSYHIGASGLTHGMFFYLFVISLFRRDKSSIAIMMAAFFMYGGMTMTIFPRDENISFEYHLFGALAGTIAALIWRNLDPKPREKAYEWENKEEPDQFESEAWQPNADELDLDEKEIEVQNKPRPIQIKRELD
ncbi:MAG: hypothetical protein Alis3KO_00210 [Aliiglaciecola sp.]